MSTDLTRNPDDIPSGETDYGTQLEQTLARERSMLRVLIDTLPDPVWFKDMQGTYLACNRRFEQFLGRPAEHIVGQTDYALMHREQADFFRHHDRLALERDAPSINEEEVVFASDGHREILETIKAPVRDEHGRLQGVLGIGRNITRRRQTERALQESEARFRRLFESVPNVAVQGYDARRRVIFWNDASTTLYGYSREEALGRQLEDLIIPEPMREQTIADITGWIAGNGPPPSGELCLRHKDGSLVPVLSSHVIQHGPNGLEMYCIDIGLTAQKQAEERLRQAASVFEHANEGIAITDADGVIVDVNAAFTRITGYEREEVLGHTTRMLKSGRHDETFYATLWQALTTTGRWTGEVWNRRKNGEVYPELLTISAVQDADGRTQRYVSLFADISEQKAHERELAYIAHYDALTGLPNRALLADRLHQAMAQASRRGLQIALAYLDLDSFKSVNDTYGHDAGDRLLTGLALRLKRVLREGDTLARLGGDEFVAVLVDLPDTATCLPLLRRMLDATAEPLIDQAQHLQVSASLGVSFYPQAEPMDADQLLRQADQAMYQAKLSGKNRYHLFDAAQDRAVRGRHERLDRIHHGLRQGEFVLHYQPKVNMREGRVVGVEALVRWQHPALGLLTPDAFLPTLEHHRLMVELGDWVIDTALAQIAHWRQAGLVLPVSVNLDAMQLDCPDFIDKLRAALARQPLVRPGDLELEVLESSALNDIAGVSGLIATSQALGVGFALDDFGTGYSSLTYLKRLQVGTLKIDQSFVRDMLDDPDDLAILEGVLGLAAAFRRNVIAEGVETEEHGEMLLKLGCELGQGYAIARPMPAEALPDWVSRWQPSALWRATVPVDRSALPVLSAIVEHRAWVWALHRYLVDELSCPPPLDLHQCNFGQWLDRTPLSATPLYRRIVSLHQDIHHQAEALLALKQAGQSAEALARFGELEDTRNALLEVLQELARPTGSTARTLPG